MKLVDEFRDVRLARSLTERIKQRSVRAARLMEFCGSHTVAIFKHGIRQLLPPGVERRPPWPTITSARPLAAAIFSMV